MTEISIIILVVIIIVIMLIPTGKKKTREKMNIKGKATVTINGVTYTGGNSVSIINGRVIIDGKEVTKDLDKLAQPVKVQWEGPAASIEADCDLEIGGDVFGDIDTSGNITCGNVKGNVDASGNVICGNVGGDIDASGSVTCGDVNGNIEAMGNIVQNVRR